MTAECTVTWPSLPHKCSTSDGEEFSEKGGNIVLMLIKVEKSNCNGTVLHYLPYFPCRRVVIFDRQGQSTSFPIHASQNRNWKNCNSLNATRRLCAKHFNQSWSRSVTCFSVPWTCVTKQIYVTTVWYVILFWKVGIKITVSWKKRLFICEEKHPRDNDDHQD